MTNKKKALIGLGALSIGVYRMNLPEYKYYGLIGGQLQIQFCIHMASTVISPGTAEEAKLLLAETVAVESLNGKAIDYSPNYGEGLTQFDRPTFEDVKLTFSNPKYDDLLSRIKTFLNVDVLRADYTDLRKSPMMSIVFARLLYLRSPGAIPKTKIGRWQYYKRFFNSVQGATTELKYMDKSKLAVFQDGNANTVA